MEEIPEETKLKVKELKEKLKTGEITKEQFHEEMKKLFPNKTQCNEEVPKKELPEETKAKLRELKTKLLNGEITEEQFQEEVDKVLPKRAIPKSIKPKED